MDMDNTHGEIIAFIRDYFWKTIYKEEENYRHLKAYKSKALLKIINLQENLKYGFLIKDSKLSLMLI